MGNFFQFEIAGDHFLDVLADQQFVQILEIGQAFEEQDPLDKLVCMLHLVDGFFVFLGGQLGNTPILVHAGMEKVLVNSGQLVAEDLVQVLDDLFIAFHGRAP